MDINQIFNLFYSTEGACYVLFAFGYLMLEQYLGMRENKQKFQTKFIKEWFIAALPIVAGGAVWLKDGMPWIGACVLGMVIGIVGVALAQWSTRKYDDFLTEKDPQTKFEINLGKDLGRLGIQLSADEVANEAKDLLKKLKPRW